MDKCDAWRYNSRPDDPGFQTCKRCLSYKPSSEYTTHSSRKNGLNSKCNACLSICRQIRENSSPDVHANRRRTKNERQKRNYDPSLKKAYYDKNRERILEQKHDYMSRSDISDHRKQYMKAYNLKNKEFLLQSGKESRENVKDRIFKKLGSECDICGESHREFLTVDHINCDGNLDRRFSSIGWKRRVLKSDDLSSYRVLCHSCNISTYILNPVNNQKQKDPVGVNKYCPTCSSYLDLSEFHKSGPHLYYECKHCKRFRNWVLRMRAIQKLGGICSCCGESNPTKLTIDHINNDGSERRKYFRECSGTAFYAKVADGHTQNVCVLCMNCNYSKHIGRGVCLHSR